MAVVLIPKISLTITNNTNLKDMNIIQHFDNLQAFSRYLAKGENTGVFRFNDCSKTATSDFAGTNSYEEACDLLTKGDRVNYSNIQKVVGYVNPNCLPSGAPGFTRAKKVCGGAVNVGAVLSGSYNCFVGRKKTQEAAKFVTINYCIGDNCNVDKDYKLQAGARLMAAIRILETNKIRCAINIICVSECREDYSGFVINVKSPATPLNEISLSYPVINPSMLRRHFFRWMEITPGIPCHFTTGYGRAVSNDKLQEVTKVDGVYLNCDKINGFLTIPELAKLIALEAK